MSKKITNLKKGSAKGPKLLVVYDGKTREYDLGGQQLLGRASSNSAPDLAVNSPIVSRKHGQFRLSEGKLTYQDLDSKNGTILDTREVEAGSEVSLRDGSILRIHPVGNEGCEHDVVMAVETKGTDFRWEKIPLGEDVLSLDVGRNQEISLRGKTVSRNHATFFHAQNGWAIIDNQSTNGVFLNGKRIVEPVLLQPMDAVVIAHHLFIFEGDALLYQADVPEVQEEPAGIPGAVSTERKGAGRKVPGSRGEAADAGALLEKNRPFRGGVSDMGGKRELPPADPAFGKADAGQNVPGAAVPPRKADEPHEAFGKGVPGSAAGRDSGLPNAGRRAARSKAGKGAPGRQLSIHIEERNAWNRLRKKTLLRDIDLQIESGSLVLILGGSGAGKTTFMNAVMGYEPAKGKISYGKSDIYREYEKMKYEIGYVPQQDLLRMEDVVYETLDNAAQMRLPDSIGPAERARRVDSALQMFGLSRERDAIIAKLSGGQRKRLSIAVEYIGNPSLFFLDEPDSGLDGIMAKELMTNLRQIADQKKIVMVISHAPDRAFDLFDKVIVLAKSDRDGSGHLVYFGSPVDACAFFGTKTLEGIVGRVNRRDEGGEGLADYYIDRFKKTGGR